MWRPAVFASQLQARTVVLVALALGNTIMPEGAQAQVKPQDQGRRLGIRRGVIETTVESRLNGAFHDVIGAAVCDSSFVVAQRSSGTLGVYGRDGSLRRQVGGIGAGPGEFQRMLWMRRSSAHRLAVYDFQSRRLSEFSCEGSLVSARSTMWPNRFGAVHPIGVLGSGAVLGEVAAAAPRSGAPQVTRAVTTLVSMDIEQRRVDSVGVYVGREIYREPFGRGGETIMPLLFGRHPLAIVGGVGFFVIPNEGNLITEHAPGGEVRARYEVGLRAGPMLRPSDVEAVRAGRRDFLGRDATRLAGVLARMPVPESLPRFGWHGNRPLAVARVMSDGSLWVVNAGGLPGDTPSWEIIRHGAVVGTVTSSTELEVLDFDGALALVLAWDDDGVEEVQVRRLRWDAGA